MASRYEIEVTIRSARNLKNVNWRKGDLRPYAVVWIDSSPKSSTKVDIDHDTDPEWDEKLIIPLPPNLSLRDATLYIDIVHADADEGVKPLVGSARLPLSEVVDDIGIGGKLDRTLKLKRPSGRPQGKLDIRVAVKEQPRYYDPYAPPPPSYGQTYGYRESRDPYGYAPPPAGYPYGGSTVPPSGYPYGGGGAAGGRAGGAAGYPSGAPPAGNPYGGSQPGYGQPAYGQPAAGSGKQSSKFGVGTGVAVGAAAGLLGGLALAEGVDLLEDKIADDVADRVEDDCYGDDF
ncbi:LOW QUALITY PROTEIN: protein SRC2 homolog [Phalaenopsis equestris]|uniref:LOW QUALITY PROTEIN: protein SRC2 homolog n=1 Tax=Phalaenopsis equestris TaxID=78828 RepID=UPI0009E5AECB|nr:LOW QUALITY PROTEIN: protein SRC2 homolog [Phalaenopsis equestris]